MLPAGPSVGAACGSCAGGQGAQAPNHGGKLSPPAHYRRPSSTDGSAPRALGARKTCRRTATSPHARGVLPKHTTSHRQHSEPEKMTTTLAGSSTSSVTHCMTNGLTCGHRITTRLRLRLRRALHDCRVDLRLRHQGHDAAPVLESRCGLWPRRRPTRTASPGSGPQRPPAHRGTGWSPQSTQGAPTFARALTCSNWRLGSLGRIEPYTAWR